MKLLVVLWILGILSFFESSNADATSNVGIEAAKINFEVSRNVRISLFCKDLKCTLETNIGGVIRRYEHARLFAEDVVRAYSIEVFSGIDGFEANHFVVRVPVDCRADSDLQCARSILIRNGTIFSSKYVVLVHR